MEVTQLMSRLSSASPAFRWSTTLLLSYATMKVAFDVFILSLATAEVPHHCGQAVLDDNRTVAWDAINASAIAADANFSIADYRCTAPRFRSDGPDRLVPLLPSNNEDNVSSSVVKCQSWVYTPVEAGRLNMLMEFDFVCDRAYLADRMLTILQTGVFVSSCFAPLADAFGRKLPFMLFIYINLASTVLAIFVPSLPAQMALRFFMGFGSPAVFTGVTYLSELISEDYRALHGNFYWILWAVGYTASGLLAYLVLQWRHQMIVVAVIVATGYLSYPWALVESPKWLFASGRKAAAKAALMRLFRRHGLDTSGVQAMKVAEADDGDDEEEVQLYDGADGSQPQTPKAKVVSPTLRFSRWSFLPKESLCQWKYISVQVILTILFVANALSYFSSSFRRDFITRNPYLNVVISGAIEFPAAVAAWMLTDRCGRRLSNMLLLITTGLLLIVVPYVPQPASVNFGAKSACALLAKFIMTIFFCTGFIFGAESLPTTIRATSIILASQAMRVGQALAPELTGFLAGVSPALPGIFYGGFCVASGLLLLLLAETRGRTMPNTIAEMRGLRLPTTSACQRRLVSTTTRR